VLWALWRLTLWPHNNKTQVNYFRTDIFYHDSFSKSQEFVEKSIATHTSFMFWDNWSFHILKDEGWTSIFSGGWSVTPQYFLAHFTQMPIFAVLKLRISSRQTHPATPFFWLVFYRFLRAINYILTNQLILF